MTPHLSTFYTPGVYAVHAAELQKSAEQFGLTVHATRYEHLTTWHEAVCWKPQHLLLAFDSLTPDDAGILWVDADARIRRTPDWKVLDDADFAACLFRWSPHHSLELLTGTLWFRHTSKVRDLLSRWCSLTEKWKHANLDTPEQHSLMEAWEDDKKGAVPLRFVELPKSWTWIEPEFNDLFVDMKPVIAHYQASRQRK